MSFVYAVVGINGYFGRENASLILQQLQEIKIIG
jgi:hypothetical protein